MKTAFDPQVLKKQAIINESYRWMKSDLISNEKFVQIAKVFATENPVQSTALKLGLFLATLMIYAGMTGFLAMFFDFISLFLVMGVGSALFLELYLIKKKRDPQSGVLTAVCWTTCVSFCLGLIKLGDISFYLYFATCALITAFFAIRYLSLLCTAASVLILATAIMKIANHSSHFVNFLPFIFMGFFSTVYFYAKSLQKRSKLQVWYDNLRVVEGLSLLIIYLAGNYFVLLEFSNAVGLELFQKSGGLPFRSIFFATTILIPLTYLYFAILKRDILLLQVTLIVSALTVLAVKWHFNLNRPEATLTIAGLTLIVLSLILNELLRSIRLGFTRKKILEAHWFNSNIEALLISQSMGATQAPKDFRGGGGSFSGGGADGMF